LRWIERSSAVPCRSHPVLVVGGGPAGLAAAIELTGHGIAAVVIERSVYDDLRIGEHLQPAAVLQLRAIDPTSKLSLDAHLASAGVEAYWGSATANHMDYFLHPGQRGLNLSRPRFDADLARACESAGATVLRSASLTHASRTSRGWEVDLTVNGKARTCHVSLIVDATGRAASFSRSQGARVRAHDRQIAVVAIANDSNHQIDNSRSIVEAVEMGWWYGAPIDAARSICMLVTDDDMLPRGANSNQRAWWFEQLGCTAQLAHRFRNFQPSQRLIVRSARSQHLDPPCGIGWLAVGDAAMAFDPLASQGIAKALDHGKRAASSIAAYLSGDAMSLERLALDLRREYASYRATRADYYRIEMRWPQSVFWKRRNVEFVTS
jgi:flavin-dependent dehydrogenase